jgi:lipoprotein signal peptidase
MQRIIIGFRLIPVFLKLLYKVFIVNEFKNLPLLLSKIKAIENKVQESFSKEYHKRFRLYTIIATIFISWLETLRNQRLTYQQQQTAILFCGLTPLFDDLFDEYHYSSTEINQLSQKKLQRGTLIEKICIGLFEEIEQINGHLAWTDLWQKVIDYQVVSQKQLDKNITKSEIIDITFGKGGYSLLLYLEAILHNDYTKEEANAVFQMGAVIQLTNDIFDIFKDRNEGIATLATTENNIFDLREYYDIEVQKNINQFQTLPFPSRNINDFLLQYRLIISRGWVALDQLQELQTEDNNRFILEKYTRKQLICDMELWKNIKKSLIYVINSSTADARKR